MLGSYQEAISGVGMNRMQRGLDVAGALVQV